MERIDKVLSHQGFGSRRDVKRILRDGLVLVNGKNVYDPGFLLDVNSDEVCVDGETLEIVHDVYLMMNKCQDVVCANKDGEHQTVFDLVDEKYKHKFSGGELHCVGRLDIDTEGLLILTTDGKLTHRILSPKNHAPKTYAVGLRDEVNEADREKLKALFKKGFFVDHEGRETGFDCAPSQLEWNVTGTPYEKVCPGLKVDCLLTITEGKYHQVKRMFAQVGNEVVYLKRVAMGSLVLDENVASGCCRTLTPDEIKLLGTDASGDVDIVL
ncbi:MAG: rRNA pseudouridine synthase [Treponema sp.]|nr:rRNA pseudouridine synthase [Treponema sp.]